MLIAKAPRSFASLVGVVAVLLIGANAFGQTVRLRDKVVVSADEDVRLGQVATISGTDARTAERLADTVVLARGTGDAVRSLKAEQVLMAVIQQQGPGGIANRLQIAGSASCEVALGASAAPAGGPNNIATHEPATAGAGEGGSDRAIAMAVVMSTEPARPEPADASPRATPSTVAEAPNRQTLARLLMQHMREENAAGEDDLRVSFETISPLLDQVAGPKQKWQFRPLNRTTLGTVQYEAQLIEGVRVVQKTNVQMKVLRRAEVLTAVATILRGDVITKEHFKVEEAWLDRKMPTLLVRDADVLGLEAQRPVAVGSMLDQRDFRPVELAPRGETLTVIFIAGSLKVQAKGRAMESGRLHDMIKIRNETTGETYQATIIGKSLAVAGGNIDAATEKALRDGR
jgi:flagella basal body P-ring formation protein FlgA